MILDNGSSEDAVRSDLHAALAVSEIGRHTSQSIEAVLVRLQNGPQQVRHSVHVATNTWTLSGIQLSEFLSELGMNHSGCPFVVGKECFSRLVPESFAMETFPDALANGYQNFRAANTDLEACGLFLRRNHNLPVQRWADVSGNGHTSPQKDRMKESDDEHFSFVLTWLVGGQDKGWTTHYGPKHPPLSPELQSAFDYLKLHGFQTCPEFDFGPCSWRFVSFEPGDNPFNSNAEHAHRWFDAHATQFSQGIQRLLAAEQEVQPYGLTFLPRPSLQAGPPLGPAAQPKRGRTHPSDAFEFDVAISFAGTERPLAEQLADLVRAKGVRVFYDAYYEEHLWGKDLPVFFDDVYRKQSRFCVVFVSKEYRERLWTNHERQAAVARQIEERGNEYILPIRVENAELPGVPSTLGYISLTERSIEQIAGKLVAKVMDSS